MTRGPLARLLAYTLLDRPLVRRAVAALLIATGAEVLGPILIKIFIDDYLRPGHWPVGPIAALAVAYVALQIITAWSDYLQSLRFSAIAVNAVQVLREQVFAKVLRLPLAFFDRTPTGNLISRITNDTEAIKDLYMQVLATYVRNSVRILGIFIAMAYLDWRLMLICFLFLPIVATLMVVYRRLSTPRFQRVRALLGEINATLHESIQGMKFIQLLNQQRRFQERFAQTADAHFHAKLHNLKLDAVMLRALIDLLQLLTLAGLLLAFGYQSFAAPVEVGVIYAFVSYLGRFAEPVMEMTQRLNLLQQAVVSGQRVFELLDMEIPPRRERAGARITRGEIAFDHVSFSYDGKRTVLDDISFRIAPGQFYAIVGHTGSGKSTIANLLLRFYDPQSGRIAIDGLPLDEIPERELRNAIGIVQQDPFVFRGTIAANIDMGRGLDEAAIIAAARQVGLHEHIEALPAGYATPLDEHGGNLSAGQRQLLSLARTLAAAPKILVLDEATANIDSHTESLVQQTLQNLRGRVTLLVIAHRLSTIQSADAILVLHQGKLVEQGTHPALLARDGLYRHLYELQRSLSAMSVIESPIKTEPLDFNIAQ